MYFWKNKFEISVNTTDSFVTKESKNTFITPTVTAFASKVPTIPIIKAARVVAVTIESLTNNFTKRKYKHNSQKVPPSNLTIEDFEKRHQIK